MYCRQILWFIAALWFVPTLFGSSAAAKPPLEIRVREYSAQNASIIEALAQLRSRASPHLLLFSLEVVPFLRAPEQNLNFSLRTGTVGQVLGKIINQDPRYDFEVIDEQLVHVFPRKSRRDPANLLNIQVEHFKVSGIAYSELVSYLPYHVPELQLELMRRGRAGGVVGSVLSETGVPTLRLELENVTVRDILNRVAQESESLKENEMGPTGWIYTFKIDNTTPLGGHPRWELF